MCRDVRDVRNANTNNGAVMDADLLKDYNEAYRQAYGYWSPYLGEADKDLACSLGNQWSTKEKNYLIKQRREALTFNKARRIVKLITGYQRKNRLSAKVTPVESSDAKTANQLSGLVQQVMSIDNMYSTMSDAYEQGSLKTGINLVELYVDYSDDPINGDIKAKRMPHNRFLLDPLFTKRDLNDCGYAVMRDYLRLDQLKAITPKSKLHILKEIPTASPRDNKFTDTIPTFSQDNNGFYRYDRFYRKEFETEIVLYDKTTGQQIPWGGTNQRLKEVLQMFPNLVKLERSRQVTKLTVFIEDQVVYDGKEPTGLIDYPFVPVLGFFEPEYRESDWKLQGIIRSIRDPQSEVNKRRSKMLDIIDSQITTGWKAKAGSVVNPESMYQSGQGQVIWLKKGSELTDAVQLNSVPVPEGIFRAIDIMDKDTMDVSAVNLEMFGQSQGDGADVSGILSKLRQGAGLTALQDLMDNYRLSKKLLMTKLIKMIQVNFTPGKVQRMLNEPPSTEFYSQQFGKYDAVPTEGVLTDTQKQMAYLELRDLKKEGAPIPWSALLEAAPLQNKQKLQEIVAQQEQAQAQQAQQQAKITEVQLGLVMSEIEKNKANTADKKAEVVSELNRARLDEIKAVAELQNIPNDQLLTLIERLQKINLTNNQIQQPQLPQPKVQQ